MGSGLSRERCEPRTGAWVLRGASAAPARRWIVAVGGLVLAALLAPAAWAVPSETCLGCHSDPSLARTTRGDSSSLFVDQAVLRTSAHAGLTCNACHADIRDVPHPEHLARVQCGSCHAAQAAAVKTSAHGGARPAGASAGCVGCHGSHAVRPAAQMGLAACSSCHARESEDFSSSVHGVAIAHGDLDAATCKSCHGSIHSALSHLDPKAPTSRARLAATCAHCHADRQLMIRRKITIPEASELYAQSVHGRSPLPGAARCNDCHESHRLRRAVDPASSIYRLNIPATCGRCHGQQQRSYEAGIHGTALRRGVTAAPVCTDCHGEHLIRGPRDPGSPVAGSAVTTTCARCHEAQGIRETYGLPAGRLSTYRDSYHGLAARGGAPAVANCASCHGYHDILPSTDPRSTVSPQRLPETCGKCHPGAGARFANGPIHVAVATPSNPILFTVRWIYLVLIVGTIGGMLLHNGLDFGSKMRAHLRRTGGPSRASTPASTAAGHGDSVGAVQRWYVRMTLFERVQHALLASSFFTLVYTGFALKFPESWPFAWLANLEHGYAWRSVIHRVAAVVMVAVSLVHVGYVFTPRGRGTLAALLPRRRDAGELVANLLYLSGLRSTPPRFDRFGYIEKAEYWALIWGTVVMTATGILLWFENQSLRWMDKWVLDLATLVHYYEAWLAFLAILVWHIYQNVFNPDVYPMNWSWVTGRIGAQQLRHEHPAEWERLEAEEAAARRAAGGAPEDSKATPEAGGAAPAGTPPG